MKVEHTLPSVTSNSRLPNLVQRLLPSRYSLVSLFPSWLDMELNLRSSPKDPAASADESVVCPHCHRSSMTNSQTSSSTARPTITNHNQANGISSHELSLVEALQILPDHQAPELPSSSFRKRVQESRPLTEFLKTPQSAIPILQRRTRSMWKRTHTRPAKTPPPPRPNRPPPNQCPPEQPHFAFSRAQIFPNAPQLAPLLPELTDLQGTPPLSMSIVSLQSPTSASQNNGEAVQSSTTKIHHDLAYNVLVGGKESLEDNFEELEAGSDYPLMPGYQVEARYPTETPTKNVAVWYQNHDYLAPRGSFSTLPSTTSKIALKPSPLRLIKDLQLEGVPPVPVRSPLRIIAGPDSDTIECSRRSSKFPVSSPLHRSSYYTMSVYSTDTNGNTVERVDTPPSSLPQTPQHQDSPLSSLKADAYIRAEEIRDELGIIDDIYNMYADSDKHLKHEACISDIKSQARFLKPLSRVDSEKVSRTQRRLQKQKARYEAARKLEGSKIDAGVQEANLSFEGWLNQTSPEETCKSSSRNIVSDHDHNPLAPTVLQRELGTSPDNSTEVLKKVNGESNTSHRQNDRKNDLSYGNSEVAITISSPEVQNSDGPKPEFINSPPTPTAKLHTHHRSSLAILQNRLQALMEDNTQSLCDLTTRAAIVNPEQSATALSTCTSTSSPSTDDIEYGPKNLQRIEIEWRGRKYPVLIGDRGRIWEGPCTDVYCKEHGGPRKQLAYGMI